MNDASHLPPALPRQRRARLKNVTSRVILSCESSGRIHIKGYAVDRTRLFEVANLIATVYGPEHNDAAILERMTATEESAPGFADPTSFLRAEVDRPDNGWVSVREMWSAYCGWADSQELLRVGRNFFIRALKADGLLYRRRRPDNGRGKMQRGWSGARLVPKASHV